MDKYYYHSIEFHPEKCDLSMKCMRVCPTNAIRIFNNQIQFIEKRCIDCGECIRYCPNNAITPMVDKLSEFSHFKYLVAIPSPTIYTQFGKNVTPQQVIQALKKIGFDEVHTFAWACDAIYAAIKEYVKNYDGKHTLISSSCPVVIRLIQVNYPEMTKQIIPIDVPKEIAAKKMKKERSVELGIKEEDICAIYITPCAAKTISIKQPAEKEKSNLDGAISITDIYNDLYGNLIEIKKDDTNLSQEEELKKTDYCDDPITDISVYWSIIGGEVNISENKDWLSVSGLNNVRKIFDDIEKGKLRNIKYLECHSCTGGCVGGTLTVENLYVARNTALYLIDNLPSADPEKIKEYIKTFKRGDYSLNNSVLPRDISEKLNIIEAIEQKKKKDEILKQLPNLECGLCGAPNCECFVDDVVHGRVDIDECIFFTKKENKDLINKYIKNK